MADEITISQNITVKKGSLDFKQYPNSFRMDMSATNPAGPYVGTVNIDTVGIDIDLSSVENPGLCIIENQDSTNYVDVGIWDPETERFYPFLKVLPGKFQTVYLSDYFGWEWVGTGTGTDTGQTNKLRGKANGATCRVLFKVFPK